MTGAGTTDSARAGLITVSVMLATIMQALDTTIANVALPYMQGGLAATQEQISWVLTSYIVAAAMMTPPTGILAARFGRKRVFLIAVAGFTVASMLCGAAVSLSGIVFFRLLQGVFGASLVPLSQAVLLDIYPPEKHGSAMAVWGVGVMVGPILGPTLGGWLTETYNWRWVFYVNLPFGILAFLGLLAVLPETPVDRERRFDSFGFALLSLSIGALQMMLDRGESQDWFSSVEIIVEAALAGLCLYLFLAHMFTAEEPFIAPVLFKDRNMVVGLLLIFLVGVVLLSTLSLLPPFLQRLMGYPVLTTGIALAPRGVGTMAAMMLAGRLIGRVDVRLLIFGGLLLLTLSLWQMSRFTPDVTLSTLISTGIVQGLGLGLVFVPLSTVAFSTLPPRLRAEGTSMYSLIRNIGSSIGISVMTFLLTRNTQVAHAGLAEKMLPFRPELAAPWLPGSWDFHTPAGLAALNAEITTQATTVAYLGDFTIMMWLTLCAAPLLLLLRGRRAAA